jgi:hypothetical protein
MRLVEIGLAVPREEIEALKMILRDGPCKMTEEQGKKVERRVNMDVELLVFGGMVLDCERLPWNDRGMCVRAED